MALADLPSRTQPYHWERYVGFPDKCRRLTHPESGSLNRLSGLPYQPPSPVGRRTTAILAADRPPPIYGEIIPIVRNHVSTSSGHRVIGNFVRRSPKACLPSANKCIST